MSSFLKMIFDLVLNFVNEMFNANVSNENDYFSVKRIGNYVYINAKNDLGCYGTLVVSKEAISQVMQITKTKALDESAFFGISGTCLKDLRIGQDLVCIFRRTDNQLKIEMVQGGKGTMSFGDYPIELDALLAFQQLHGMIIRLFEPAEIESTRQLRNHTLVQLDDRYKYVHK